MNTDLEGNKSTEVVIFSTRQEACSRIYSDLISRGVDLEEAITRAADASAKYAEAMGLPEKVTPKVEGFEGWLQKLKALSEFAKENPTVLEIGLPIIQGVFGTLAGITAGTAIADRVEERRQIEPLVVDEEDYPE